MNVGDDGTVGMVYEGFGTQGDAIGLTIVFTRFDVSFLPTDS